MEPIPGQLDNTAGEKALNHRTVIQKDEEVFSPTHYSGPKTRKSATTKKLSMISVR